jgi:hypothetical protein
VAASLPTPFRGTGVPPVRVGAAAVKRKDRPPPAIFLFRQCSRLGRRKIKIKIKGSFNN